MSNFKAIIECWDLKTVNAIEIKLNNILEDEDKDYTYQLDFYDKYKVKVVDNKVILHLSRSSDDVDNMDILKLLIKNEFPKCSVKFKILTETYKFS